MKLLIFSLGAKGFSVVRALAESPQGYAISCVIGEDANVSNDYSAELAAYCQQKNICHVSRKSADPGEFEFEFALAIGWRWIIHDIPEHKLIVFHDSLLPRYRGFAPLVNALINMEAEAGVTALFGAKDYDRGNILLQKRMPLRYPTTIGHVIEQISGVYAELSLELLEKIQCGEIPCTGFPQNELAATYSLWRDEDDYRINWHNDAEALTHFIRCVGEPYRGASAILNNSLVRIINAEVVPDVRIENRIPGKVIFMEGGMPVVVCGKGLLKLSDIRDEQGQAVLPLTSFRTKFQ